MAMQITSPPQRIMLSISSTYIGTLDLPLSGKECCCLSSLSREASLSELGIVMGVDWYQVEPKFVGMRVVAVVLENAG